MAGNQLSNILSVARNAANQVNQVNRDLAVQTERELEGVTDSASSYQLKANKSLAELDRLDAKREEVKRMNSNPFGRLAGIVARAVNPQDYTMEGRAKQRAAIQSSLAARGQIHNINVTASQARIKERQAEANIQLIDANADMNILRAQNERLAAETQQIQLSEALRQARLGKLGSEEVNTLLTEAGTRTQNQNSDAQGNVVDPAMALNDIKINVDGFEFSATEIRERQKQLQVRDSLAMLAPEVTSSDYAAKLQAHQNLILGHSMSLAEMEDIRGNGGIMPDGTMVDPALLDSHINRQKGIQAESGQKLVRDYNIQNALPAQIEQGTRMADMVAGQAEPGTPLYAAAQKHKGLLAATAKAMQNAQNPAETLAFMDMVNKSSEVLRKGVSAEAKRLAGGDKDLQLVYENRMMGIQTNPQQMHDIISKRLEGGKGMAAILPGIEGRALQDEFNKELSTIQQEEAAKFADPNQATLSKKEMREAASNRAIKKYITAKQKEAVSMAERWAMNQQDFPATLAGLSPAEVDHLNLRAQTETRSVLGEQMGFSPEQVMAIHQGKEDIAGVEKPKVEQYRLAYNSALNATFFGLLEAEKDGLGSATANWYMQNGDKLTNAYLGSLGAEASGTEALIRPYVVDGIRNLQQEYGMAAENATRAGFERLMQYSTQSERPEIMLPIVIQNSNMQEGHKKRLWDEVIKPAIDSARAQDMNNAGVMSAIEKALQTKPQTDPVMKSAIGTFIRELPTERDKYELMYKQVMYTMQNRTMGGWYAAQWGLNRSVGQKELKNQIPWLNEPSSTGPAQVQATQGE